MPSRYYHLVEEKFTHTHVHVHKLKVHQTSCNNAHLSTRVWAVPSFLPKSPRKQREILKAFVLVLCNAQMSETASHSLKFDLSWPTFEYSSFSMLRFSSCSVHIYFRRLLLLSLVLFFFLPFLALFHVSLWISKLENFKKRYNFFFLPLSFVSSLCAYLVCFFKNKENFSQFPL